VLAGRDQQLVENASLVMEGSRIASIGAEGSTDNAIDASGLTLVPGFIDAHVHIGFHRPNDVARAGVTTVRDLGWPAESIEPLVAASLADSYDGPTIHSVGPIITAPGGYPTRAGWAPHGTGLEVDGPDAATAAVDDLAAKHVAAIKIALNPPVGPVLEDATLEAIVTRAHEHSLKVTVHADGLDQLERALDARVDELAHMLLGTDRIPDRTIDRMVEQEMAVVPTLSIRYGWDRRRTVDNLARFARAGGTVVYGTDLGNAGPRPGIDPREVKAMVAAGMTARAIVASATTVAREWLGLADVGVLEVGASADVVALGGSPLEVAGDLTDVRMVWRRGRRLR
jgi:imidazolonepropionase-like amidohydrolase